LTCKSVRSRTLVLWMERSSMWRTPHFDSTSICCCGSGPISSAKALRVNMVRWSFRVGWVERMRDPPDLGGPWWVSKTRPTLRRRRRLRLSGPPEHVVLSAVVVDAGQHEEEVGKAVQVDDHLRVDRLGTGQRHDVALGAAADGAGQVAPRRGD